MKDMFTKREVQILMLMAKGRSASNFAQSLCITMHTLKTHKKNMMRKIRETGTGDSSLLEFAIRYQEESKRYP